MKSPTVINKASQLYAKMQMAIAICYSVDDCKKIADQANAIAAYYKQIKDDESVRKFLAVKLRAWRRIGEILITIDDSDCGTQTAYVHKIRNAFVDNEFVQMSDWSIINSVKLARLPDDFFAQAVETQPSVDRVLSAYQNFLREEWEASPEGQAELERRRQYAEECRIRRAEEEKQAAVEAAKEREEALREMAELRALKEARDAAADEVGVTLDRRDREQMKQVILLIKEPIHALLRQAAFDQHMTMQAILRSGLAMWFFANGYGGGMEPEPRGDPPKPSAPGGAAVGVVRRGRPRTLEHRA